MSPNDPIESILNKIRPAGYTGGRFADNDRIHRVSVTGDKHRERSGSIRLANTGQVVIGWFRNHRTGESIPLGVDIAGERISQAEMRRIQKEMEAKRTAEQAQAAAASLRLWQAADAPNPNHPYLVRKGIQPYSCRQKGQFLIIPAIDVSGNIKTLQTIESCGTKIFFSGGSAKGHFCPIGMIREAPQVAVCEGYATGCSIHEATGLPVVCAFNASNLAPVCSNLQTIYGTKFWIICGDDDRYTDGNPGRLGAEQAMMAIRRRGSSGRVVFPSFSGEHRLIPDIPKPSDMNDLHRLAGLTAVRKAIFT